MFDPSSFVNPTPLAHADASRDVLPRGGPGAHIFPCCFPQKRGRGSLVIKVSDHGRHDMSSSPVPLKTRRVGQRWSLNLSRAETSFRWCGVVVRRRVPTQVSFTSLDHGSKLSGPSPKALVKLNSATLIFTHIPQKILSGILLKMMDRSSKSIIRNRMKNQLLSVNRITPFLCTCAPLNIAGSCHLTSPRQPMTVRQPMAAGHTCDSETPKCNSRCQKETSPPLMIMEWKVDFVENSEENGCVTSSLKNNIF
ncbi:uncharacterized protein TNCV_2721801 [Trichonephila clavipes]|nr:uncharacterized protein TNCV_2721801 [Trichonephila clavipes]